MSRRQSNARKYTKQYSRYMRSHIRAVYAVHIRLCGRVIMSILEKYLTIIQEDQHGKEDDRYMGRVKKKILNLLRKTIVNVDSDPLNKDTESRHKSKKMHSKVKVPNRDLL